MDKLKMKPGRIRLILTIVVIIVILFSIISMAASKVVYDRQFPRYERPDYNLTAQLRYEDFREQYPRDEISFFSGETRLSGYLYDAIDPDGLIVLAHGIGGGADSYLPQIFYFLDKGWQVFAYDSTGSFDSDGESTKGFPQSILDLNSALEYIHSQDSFRDMKTVVFGHSWGGYAASNIMHLTGDVDGIITVAAPSYSMDILMETGRDMMGVFIYTQYPFLWLYQRILFGETASLKGVDAINQSGIPALIIHGTRDDFIGIDNSALIAKRDQITNPHVTYYISDEEGRNGHNDLFRSDDAILYFDRISREYADLYDEHEGFIPYEKDKAFYDSLDRLLIYDLDDGIMGAIDSFLRDVIS